VPGSSEVQLSVRRIHRALADRGETVAVAESLTGGLLSAALSEPAGASTAFRGGLVVYATDLKAALAGVDAELLVRRGAVDREVAEQLARGVSRRLRSEWGLGITGVAGPDRQDDRPVGTVYIAVAGPADVLSSVSLSFIGNRNTIRQLSVTHAVGLLADVLIGAR
jgi:nicotinamide-nucleotide amidase